MNIKAIHNHILFQFLDRVNYQGQFEEQQSLGGILILSDHDKSAKSPRWAKIISLGPDCSDVFRKEGCEILIENLRWTPGVKYQGENLWRTDEDQILAYRYPEDTNVAIGA